MSLVSRRLGALVAASALTATGLTLAAPPAQAAADPRPLDQAISYLKNQLVDDIMLNPAFGGIEDYGLSADVALSLKALGKEPETVKAIGKAVREHYYSWVTDYDSGFGNPSSPTELTGSMAKALVLSQVAGSDPSVYRDKVQADIEDNLYQGAPLTGRIRNINDFVYPPPDFNPVPGDNANVFGQSFAARALVLADSDDKAAVLDFLLDQQCADGGFREKFDASDDPNQECGAGDTATYGDRIGATATAVINLQAIASEPGVNVTAALASARAWLVTQQNANGSWGTGTGNANNTGLAAQALGETADTAEAAQWLRDFQANDTDACTGLKKFVGAVALDEDTLTDGRNEGVPLTAVGTWQRSTSQVLYGLSLVQAGPAVTLNLTGPNGYQRGGSPATYQVSGAAAGAKLCTTVANNFKAGVANASGSASIALPLPSSTANRTVTVVDKDGNTDTVVTKVLGPARFTLLKKKSKVTSGKSVTVIVYGLAPGEKVTVSVKGDKVSGVATAQGRFAAKLKPSKKVGKKTIRAVGQFPDRTGSTTVKVVKK
ncbi:hypothetical protein ABIE44_000550 [Marmoricola sp. OAE513]|uniref:prenyltransferase/squalene oxidase repeat-containing protein n=1 Tax=Marmoricola sp. OAE513 TaxID=2817894 RepID=UPI001AE17DAF